MRSFYRATGFPVIQPSQGIILTSISDGEKIKFNNIPFMIEYWIKMFGSFEATNGFGETY